MADQTGYRMLLLLVPEIREFATYQKVVQEDGDAAAYSTRD